MNPFVLSITILSLTMGTMITFSSSHWLLAWIGLEINTLALIPLMAQHTHPRAIEAATKYFIIQATAATLILYMALTNAWLTGQWDIGQVSHPLIITITTLALGAKLGMAPTHFWLVDTLQGLNWGTGLILSTWQKLGPLALMYQLAWEMTPGLPLTLGVLSIFMGGWGGLNQTQLRKVMAYSSVTHMGWMIVIMEYLPNLMAFTLIIYLVLTTSTFLALKMMKVTSINMLTMAWTKDPLLTGILMMGLLSLGGLPPLTGFLPKWMILQELVNQEMQLVALIMAMATLLSLYFYLRLTYSMILTIFPTPINLKTMWRHSKSGHSSFLMAVLLTHALLLLPLAPAALAAM
uniref:NADH-ubiquinone oxidoreductase chain 2 n=1 Tax=Monognathus jesperseni TaxID=556250 RepID=D1YUD2_9TELE|nr:NADH dehydrogenase subunit 2 [Monognathus jesperseni]